MKVDSVIGAFRVIPIGLVRILEKLEISRLAEIIQTTALLRSDGIWRKVQGTWEIRCHTDFSERPSVNASVKNRKV